MRWAKSNRFDDRARVIADRHYNRQKIGNRQFAPPGRLLALVIPGDAFWVTSWPQYVRHAWPGTWCCTAFRNERADRYLSSTLVADALSASRWKWPEPPTEGMITFVNRDKTRPKQNPGYCFLRAGFHVSGTLPCCADKPSETGKGLVALHMSGLSLSALPAVEPLQADYYEILRAL